MKVLDFRNITVHTDTHGNSFVVYKDNQNYEFSVATVTDTAPYDLDHDGIVILPDDVFTEKNFILVTS